MKRDTAVDQVKALAIFGVLLIHVSAVGGYAGGVGSASWCAALLWGSVLRCAVPLFFLCTGALFLDPAKELSLPQIWGKYLARILIALFFWAAAYEAFSLFLAWRHLGVLELAALKKAVADLLLFRHENHLYYLHITILVYALLPLLRLLAAAERRVLEYLLGVWLVLGVLWPALRPFPPFSLLGGIPAQFPLNLTWASLGYCLLGWYLKCCGKERRPRFWLSLYALGLVFTYGATLLLSFWRGELYQGFLNGTAPGVCLQAAGLFGFFRAGGGTRPAPVWVETLSKASFCVYLTHMFFLHLLERRGLTAASFHPLWFVPLCALLLLLCGLAVWAILRKLPLVRRYLI